MPEDSLFQSLENVLARIEEIKRRFGLKGRYIPSGFDIELESQKAKLTKQDITEEKGGVEGIQVPLPHISYGDVIKAASETYRIPEPLIKAIIKQESDFNNDAVSEKGAMGLMQLMPETARLLGVEDAFDVEENIFGGVRYLRELINLYGGNLNKALAAYNAGPERVGDEVPEIPETRKFIDTVLNYYNNFSKYQEDEGL